ncbi:hypothetical protein GCM10023170_098280 [Phytohabitans houttuyneae]
MAVALIITIPGTAGAKPKPPGPSTAPPDVAAKMQAQQPAVTAANEIRRAINLSDPGGYSGIELVGTSVRLWYKGSLPTAVSAAVERARKITKVEVAEARYSNAELQTASDRLIAHIRGNPAGPAHSVKIPTDGHGLVVMTDRAVTFAATGLPDVGVATETGQRERFKAAGRVDDYAPFWGGARIENGEVTAGCSAGFGVRSGGREYLLTVGHCGRVGSPWYNGNFTHWIGWAAYERPDWELLLIETNAGGFVFDGPLNAPISRRVAGWNWAYPTMFVCSSGAYTGGQCGGLVVDGTYSVCGPDAYGNSECYHNLVASYGPDPAARHGDSGGPVFIYSGDNVIALGIISGWTGPVLYWSQFGLANSAFGVEPITGP